MPKSQRRRVLNEIDLEKVAAVDEPCQEHARAKIMKRKWTAQERKDAATAGHALPDGSFPIENKADLGDAVQAIGRAKDPAKAKAHITSRAKALDATDQLPDDWKVTKAGDAGTNHEGVTMSLKKMLGLPETASDDDVAAAFQKQRETDAAALAKAQEVSQEAVSVSLMTDVHKGYYGALPAATDADQEIRKGFRGMSTADRDALIAKAKGDEDSFTSVTGVKITKSAAGALFEFFKSQDDEIRKSRAETAEIRAQADTAIIHAEIAKSFNHVPGTSDDKLMIMKAARTLPKPVGEAITRLMTAVETMAKSYFFEKGKGGGKMDPNADDDADDPQEKAMKKIREIAKAKGITEAQATVQFMDTPEFTEIMTGADALN